MAEIDWAGLLAEEDVEGLWNGLYQLVSRHPAARPLHFATDGAAVLSQTEINADLTQELFLELFQKQRFDHYVDNDYKSIEIENELARIEIPNLVGARLRKRYPESFRMARRVSSLLKGSERFRRFGQEADPGNRESAKEATKPKRRGRPPKQAKKEIETLADVEQDDVAEFDDSAEPAESHNGGPRRRRMVSQVFGLREWPPSKKQKDSGHFTDLIREVPMRRRETRLVGRSGSSQLILSNPELEELIVEVLTAIDSPADVRTIRQLVLSKIPLQDYNVSSLDEELSTGYDGSTLKREAADTRRTPEDLVLDDEQDLHVAQLAGEFLLSLRRAVNSNERRYSRLLLTMWYCYYDPAGPSQLEIARMLGVSDSLVSDNRRLVEHELKKLKLSVEDAVIFSESLHRLLSKAQRAHST